MRAFSSVAWKNARATAPYIQQVKAWLIQQP